MILHNFLVERNPNTTKVTTRSGDLVAFVDHGNHDQEAVIKFMHDAYIMGIFEGRKRRNKELRELLGL